MMLGAVELEKTESDQRLMLIDTKAQLHDYTGYTGFKVLLRNAPVNADLYHFWCKTPINEHSVDNMLFYFERWNDQPFINGNATPTSVSLLEDFIGNDPELIKEVISEFVDNTSTNMRIILQSIMAGQLHVVAEIAHRMLSSISYYEVNVIKDLLKDLERPFTKDPEVLMATARGLEHQIRHLRSGLVTKYF